MPKQGIFNGNDSLLSWKESGAYYSFRGHRIFYRKAGEGPALLLLGGIPFASWSWSGIWPLLEGRYTLYALDLPGLGFSDKPDAFTYSIADLTDLVDLFIRAKEIRELEILAHDLGQWIALELMRRMDRRASSRMEVQSIRKVCFCGAGAMSVLWKKRSFGLFGKKNLHKNLLAHLPSELQQAATGYMRYIQSDQKLAVLNRHLFHGKKQMETMALDLMEGSTPFSVSGDWPDGLFEPAFDLLLQPESWLQSREF